MQAIANFFQLDERDTDFRTEVMGGATTFVTMAYIVVVNPGILSEALGQDLFGELLFATCISAAVGSLLMGILANYPFALAPGMGLNAFFSYTVVLGMGVRWDLALGVVLGSGLLFLLLTFLRVREAIITAVPEPLKRAAAATAALFVLAVGVVLAANWWLLSRTQGRIEDDLLLCRAAPVGIVFGTSYWTRGGGRNPHYALPSGC